MLFFRDLCGCCGVLAICSQGSLPHCSLFIRIVCLHLSSRISFLFVADWSCIISWKYLWLIQAVIIKVLIFRNFWRVLLILKIIEVL
ncbi:unnamed protein product [Moneuplotes crassus]|uniref:Uncharacterized protein n=1 Tax=Euplotes crassus TaxID=5936 RepID=A0AAD1U690_EUPCR|nr:unnamed protein product [Moneuplotes crassus]